MSAIDNKSNKKSLALEKKKTQKFEVIFFCMEDETVLKKKLKLRVKKQHYACLIVFMFVVWFFLFSLFYNNLLIIFSIDNNVLRI